MKEERVELAGIPTRVYRPHEPSGLLLLGHRGGQSKDHPRFVELGRRYAVATGLAVACIDAPAHGERTPATGDSARDFDSVVATVTGPQDVTVPDWHAVANELASVGPPVAYVGFSMGAMMGLAVIAAMPTIEVGVLWVAGLPPAPPGTPRAQPNPFVMAARAAGHAQILMINMTDDDVMGPARALDLFDLIEGRQKRLLFYPGTHDTEPEDAIEYSAEFVRRHISDGAPSNKAGLRGRAAG